MTLPLPDRLQIVGGSLGGLLSRHLCLSCCFELPGEGSRLGPAPTNKAMAAGFGIIDLDDLLLRGWLAIGHVALLASVGSLALSSHGGRA